MVTVTVYTTGPSCIRCKMTKNLLTQKGIPFEEIDVRDNEAGRARVMELGYTAAPVVIVEDGTDSDHWSEFRPDQIARVAAMNDVDDYTVPTDPMDDLACDSCQ